MYFLVTRNPIESSNNAVPNPDQKLTILEALKSYTTWAAYSSFEEKMKGSIEKGKVADMVVISEDIFNQNPDILLKVKVLKTIINGAVKYSN
jgi:predicted amidohydrolase YtcJ